MVSVIIPVYNAEKYLSQTIDSVLSQTYTDWELILVDDGSTDSSGNICDEACAKDSRIKVYHISNGGLSCARNLGLDNAAGDFIFFLDADDLLPSRAIETLLLFSKECDIVSAPLKHFKDSKRPSDKCVASSLSNYTLSSIEALENILYQKNIDNSACGKLYSSNIWKGVRFRAGTGYEDLDIISSLFLKANRVVILETPLYYYRQHKESYIHTFSLNRADVLEVTKRLTDYVSAECPELLKAARSRQLSANFNMLGLIAANRKYIEGDAGKANEIAYRCWNKIKELRGESLRNPSVRLKNKIGIVASYIGGRRLVEVLSLLIYK